MLIFCYKKLDTSPILRIVACNKESVTTYIIKGQPSFLRRPPQKKITKIRYMKTIQEQFTQALKNKASLQEDTTAKASGDAMTVAEMLPIFEEIVKAMKAADPSLTAMVEFGQFGGYSEGVMEVKRMIVDSFEEAEDGVFGIAITSEFN